MILFDKRRTIGASTSIKQENALLGHLKYINSMWLLIPPVFIGFFITHLSIKFLFCINSMVLLKKYKFV